ncbi:bub protein kinase [Moniliophthora roreri MCA 2997]|uniref:Bub protein kinase n=1 Tax=Moniliophthora roreri (strain MCA 2997) TaxID=1381753 RepID=V2YSK9_MONRO|nr:bub protein kinase [Moniliophthora roreri MCA 2997]
MPPSSSKSTTLEDLKKKRELFEKKKQRLNEEDDPLAIYVDFVQWLVSNFPGDDAQSGLSQLLEEATNAFKNDQSYKSDLRYLKLWTLRARKVDVGGALSLYSHLLKNDIGTSYSLLYEEYAQLLEAKNRIKDADVVYRKGIKRQARPTERLKKRYLDFQKRHEATLSTSSPASNSSAATARPATTNAQLQRAKQPPLSSAPAGIRDAKSRYEFMLAPPEPGKRPEKYEFHLPLLYTEEHGEFCIEEARARSMGLLGKQWPPLPTSNPISSSSSAGSSQLTVIYKDEQRTGTRSLKRKSMAGGEPTVTINTKEALADVFGMYNSPDRTLRVLAGSKHAPVKRVEPMMSLVAPPKAISPPLSSENAVQNGKPSFRPFVDENAGVKKKENKPSKSAFTPFVDPGAENDRQLPSRSALAAKDPSSIPTSKTPLQPSKISPFDDQKQPFIFKPFVPEPKDSSLREVHTEEHGKPMRPPTHERAKSFQDILNPTDAASADPSRSTPFFAPFVDQDNKTPFKVFSRPSEGENAFTPKTPSAAVAAAAATGRTFTPFSDIKPTFTPYKDTQNEPAEPKRRAFAVLSESIEPPEEEEQRTIEAPPQDEADEPEEPSHHDVSHHPEDEEEYDYTEEGEYDDHIEGESPQEYHEPIPPDDAEKSHFEYDEDAYQERDVPLGGRFGQFNVMTPITERTFEYTSTRSFYSTPSDGLKYIPEDPNDIPEEEAERAMLDTDDTGGKLSDDVHAVKPFRLPESHPDDSDVSTLEQRANKLSLADTLALSASFKPSNPCNPFDPPILQSLLSRLHGDSHLYDLTSYEYQRLEELQKFAKKLRKTSAGSNSGLDVSATFSLILDNHKFCVTGKLGEGGFGAVFSARDLGVSKDGDDSDDDMLDDLDEDEDNQSMVAVKVVKPRNFWEYHVLRRLHSALPVAQRRSVVLPYALYAFKDESYLVMDLCPQGTLLDIVNRAESAGVSQQGACLDELLVMFFAIELMRLLEAMHNIGFIHGDLKIDNCLLRLEDVPGGTSAWSSTYQPSGEGGWNSKGLKLIDFGRTIDTRLFPAGQTFIGEWQVDERDCLELREGRPWTFQTDYFGLAGIIYCMFFGKYISASALAQTGDGRWKISTPFKRYWQTDLWMRLFDVLLNPKSVRSDGSLPVLSELGTMRKEMEGWLQNNCNRTSGTLKGLLKKVEMSCLR